MKNLAKHKIAVKTREVLVQAIYQHLFNKTPSKEILEQFRKEHRPEKVDFKRFNHTILRFQPFKSHIHHFINKICVPTGIDN